MNDCDIYLLVERRILKKKYGSENWKGKQTRASNFDTKNPFRMH